MVPSLLLLSSFLEWVDFPQYWTSGGDHSRPDLQQSKPSSSNSLFQPNLVSSSSFFLFRLFEVSSSTAIVHRRFPGTSCPFLPPNLILTPSSFSPLYIPGVTVPLTLFQPPSSVVPEQPASGSPAKHTSCALAQQHPSISEVHTETHNKSSETSCAREKKPLDRVKSEKRKKKQDTRSGANTSALTVSTVLFQIPQAFTVTRCSAQVFGIQVQCRHACFDQR